MTAQEAKEYGLVDEVMEPAFAVPAGMSAGANGSGQS